MTKCTITGQEGILPACTLGNNEDSREPSPWPAEGALTISITAGIDSGCHEICGDGDNRWPYFSSSAYQRGGPNQERDGGGKVGNMW